MQTNLTKLTLIIPSYERPQYIKRLINYWGKFSVFVHILDGSKCSIDETLNLDEKSQIYYHHLPISIEERFKFAQNLITTPYAALLSDDEFFLPNAVDSCINFLETNLSYVSCTGISMGFNWQNSKVISSISYPDHKGIDICHDNCQSRMAQLMSNYQLICLWSIVRSDVLKKSLKAMGADRFSCAGVAEIQNALITTANGGCKVLDELLWMRSYENANQWWSFGRQIFSEWYRDTTKKHEQTSFMKSIVENIGLPQLTEQKKKQILSEVISLYLDYEIDSKSKVFFNKFKYKTLNYLDIISSFLGISLKEKLMSEHSIFETAEQLEFLGIDCNKADLLLIEKQIIKHHIEMN